MFASLSHASVISGHFAFVDFERPTVEKIWVHIVFLVSTDSENTSLLGSYELGKIILLQGFSWSIMLTSGRRGESCVLYMLLGEAGPGSWRAGGTGQRAEVQTWFFSWRVVASIFLHSEVGWIPPSVFILHCYCKGLLKEYVLLSFKLSNSIKSEDGLLVGQGWGKSRQFMICSRLSFLTEVQSDLILLPCTLSSFIVLHV